MKDKIDELLDDILTSPMKTKAEVTVIPITQVVAFENHPYKVEDNDEMQSLTESIHQNGILTPLVVRPIANDKYELVSGHRRIYAAQKAGIAQISALIYPLDRTAATIALVDSNLHREHILPSEKAFAYKMKMEALNHQGRTSGQVGQKWSRDEISDTESGRQIQRYIRLTNLIPEILQMVDEKKIALTPAVELSYLSTNEQVELFATIESEDRTPSLAQAQRMRNLSTDGRLNVDAIFSILTEEKANQKEKIAFKVEELRNFFPKHYTPKQMNETILRLLMENKRKLERSSRDER